MSSPWNSDYSSDTLNYDLSSRGTSHSVTKGKNSRSLGRTSNGIRSRISLISCGGILSTQNEEPFPHKQEKIFFKGNKDLNQRELNAISDLKQISDFEYRLQIPYAVRSPEEIDKYHGWVVEDEPRNQPKRENSQPPFPPNLRRISLDDFRKPQRRGSSACSHQSISQFSRLSARESKCSENKSYDPQQNNIISELKKLQAELASPVKIQRNSPKLEFAAKSITTSSGIMQVKPQNHQSRCAINDKNNPKDLEVESQWQSQRLSQPDSQPSAICFETMSSNTFNDTPFNEQDKCWQPQQAIRLKMSGGLSKRSFSRKTITVDAAVRKMLENKKQLQILRVADAEKFSAIRFLDRETNLKDIRKGQSQTIINDSRQVLVLRDLENLQTIVPSDKTIIIDVVPVSQTEIVQRDVIPSFQKTISTTINTSHSSKRGKISLTKLLQGTQDFSEKLKQVHQQQISCLSTVMDTAKDTILEQTPRNRNNSFKGSKISENSRILQDSLNNTQEDACPSISIKPFLLHSSRVVAVGRQNVIIERSKEKCPLPRKKATVNGSNEQAGHCCQYPGKENQRYDVVGQIVLLNKNTAISSRLNSTKIYEIPLTRSQLIKPGTTNQALQVQQNQIASETVNFSNLLGSRNNNLLNHPKTVSIQSILVDQTRGSSAGGQFSTNFLPAQRYSIKYEGSSTVNGTRRTYISQQRATIDT